MTPRIKKCAQHWQKNKNPVILAALVRASNKGGTTLSGFGLVDILLLGAAIGLAMLLRGNLGRNPARRPRVAASSVSPPDTRGAPLPRSAAPSDIASAAAPALDEIGKIEPDFTPSGFLEGAEKAYDMVLQAFARGQQALLENLLDPPVMASFVDAIKAREEAGEKSEIKKLRLKGTDIVAAAVGGNPPEARITVRFSAQQVAWRHDEEGRVVSGHPSLWRDIIDVWQFRRELGAQDPTWRISRTSSEAPLVGRGKPS